MTTHDLEQLVLDYYTEVIRARPGVETDAADRLQTLIWHDPECAWEVAIRVLKMAHGEVAAAIVGAGPLEQLLNSYPEQFIGRATELAKRDEQLLQALKYVDIRSGEIPEEHLEELIRIQDAARRKLQQSDA